MQCNNLRTNVTTKINIQQSLQIYMLKYEMLFLKSKEVWNTAANQAKGHF